MSIPAAGAKPPPGRGWYVLAGVLVIAAIAASAVFVVYRVSGLGSRLLQVVVPGQAELSLDEPGSYTIFHEYNSVVDGRVYSSASLSGLRVRVTSPEGRAVKLTSPTTTSRYSFSGREGIAVFTFDVAKPGLYRVAASYENGRAEPRTVLTVGGGFVGGVIVTVLVTLLIAFAGIGAAIAVAVVVYLARRRARLASASGS
jgi:hypothetical protein